MANAYTLVQALQAAGKNLTRQAVVDAINQQGAKWTGPGLVPFRYSHTDHGGYSGTQIGQIKNGKIVLTGTPLTTTPDPTSPITPYTTTQPAARSHSNRRPQQLKTTAGPGRPTGHVLDRAQDAGGRACGDRERRDVRGDDRVGADHAALADRHPAGDHDVGAAPDVVADPGRALGREALPRDRLVGDRRSGASRR